MYSIKPNSMITVDSRNSAAQAGRRTAVIGGLLHEPEAGLLGHMDRGPVVRRNDAYLAHVGQVRLGPCAGRGHRLAGVALAVRMRRQDPAELQHAVHGRLDVAPEVGEADVADIESAVFFLDRPVAIAEHHPQAGIVQQAAPGLFRRHGLAIADVADHRGLGPHRDVGVVVRGTMRAQAQPLGFEHGHRDTQRIGSHQPRLSAVRSSAASLSSTPLT
jgi:hypothetical protein